MWERSDKLEYLTREELDDVARMSLTMGWQIERPDNNTVEITWNKEQPEPDVYTWREDMQW